MKRVQSLPVLEEKACEALRWDALVTKSFRDDLVCTRDYTGIPLTGRRQHHELTYFHRGQGRVWTGGRTYPVAGGEMVLIRAEDFLRFEVDEGESLERHALQFEVCDERGRYVRLPETRFPVYRRTDDPPFWHGAIRTVRNLFYAGYSRESAHWMKALLTLYGLDLERHEAGGRNDRLDRLSGLCERIRRDPANAPTVAAMVRGFHSSHRHFIECFRAYAGETPRRYLLRARMEKAEMLLRETNWTVARIAGEIGYANPFKFSEQFKTWRGASPSGYRANHGAV
ncbi:helix-turn-helix domain-containing protein [Kiritimatiella glycovorans]|uniref:AraC family transcriptional regulator n=1 Tax=Kiritimatiella glycovorans TaxID=1307763 RepID=A0A0G3EJH9_9BACT|nr:AraC family transcriptional regulator [Kiritimatiella glycovorans]AKJ65602.1 AraC family transcriptional regulator [Kiritimatiella glycovorans]